jgi:hypothetical protein
MKDFYDIWLLSRQFDFDGTQLAEAIRLTFERRGTALPITIEVFAQPFVDAKQVQWTAFRTRLGHDHVPAPFMEIAIAVDKFLSPIIASLLSGRREPASWTAPGPWS